MVIECGNVSCADHPTRARSRKTRYETWYLIENITLIKQQVPKDSVADFVLGSVQGLPSNELIIFFCIGKLVYHNPVHYY